MIDAASIRQFAEQGYTVTRITLDPAARRRAIDLVWELLPSEFERENHLTWNGVVKDSCHTKDLHDRRGRLKFRECVRRETWLYDLLAGHPEAVAAAESLLGAGQVAAPKYFRGLYPVFPCPPGDRRVEKGHLDTHPFQLGAVLYLEDVAPGGGGFHVWPGSHIPVAMAHRSLHEDDPEETCEGIVERWQKTAAPVEISGPAGTLILWHQRLIHAAGLNRSNRVRQAMLCDFSRPALADFQALPPADALWDHWADSLRLRTPAPASA